VHYPCTLTLPQRDRIRWHLFPEVRLQTQSALDLEPESEAIKLTDLLQMMDLQQEQIARSLGEGHRVIHGAAGSGKTMILVFRAVQLAAATGVDRPILVLCYNRALADRIDSMLRRRGMDERVQVRTFHPWCQDMVRTYQLDVPKGLKRHEYFMRVAEVVSLAVAQGDVPAGQPAALLIDEAHDFDDDWLRIAGRTVSSETNSLLVLYDDVQSIYQKQRRTFNFSSVGINAVGRINILKLNYRNTAEVMTLALHCAQGLLDRKARTENELQVFHPALAGRRGVLSILLEGRNDYGEADLIAERIVGAINEGTPINDIAALARAKYLLRSIGAAIKRKGIAFQSMQSREVRDFDWSIPSVKLLTMPSCKGLEFQRVFVAGLQALPMKDDSVEDALRLLSVAMTRAAHELTLSTYGSSVIVDRVKASIQVVRRQMQ